MADVLRGDGFELRGFLSLSFFSFTFPGDPARDDEDVRDCDWRVPLLISLVWTARLNISFLFFGPLSFQSTRLVPLI
jgi:hypothetical protein